MHPTQNPASPALGGPTPADILRGAALYIGRHGWHQGAFYPEHHDQLFPPACADGAIRLAVCGRPVRFLQDLTDEESRQVAAAESVFVLHLGYLGDDIDDTPMVLIGYWNDEGWRTSDRVIAELDLAAFEWELTHNHTDGGVR